MCLVAPLAGAWIEIYVVSFFCSFDFVAPLAGAWIEIQKPAPYPLVIFCRSPRGSVD